MALFFDRPSHTIPNGINPQQLLFGAERVKQGALYLV